MTLPSERIEYDFYCKHCRSNEITLHRSESSRTGRGIVGIWIHGSYTFPDLGEERYCEVDEVEDESYECDACHETSPTLEGLVIVPSTADKFDPVI